MFRIEAIPGYLADIALFLSTDTFPEYYSATQKRHMVVRVAYYQLIAGQLHKLRLDSLLRRCVMDHVRLDVLWECHSGVARTFWAFQI